MRFTFRRRLPLSAVVFSVLAVASAVAAFVLVNGYAARFRVVQPQAQQRREVVVAARSIQVGTRITAADVTLASVPVDGTVAAPVTAIDAAIDRYALTAFDRGEVLGSHRLSSDGTGPLSASIPPGLVGVTLPVSTVPPGLVAGDHVAVIGTFAGPHPYTTLLADDVRAVAIAAGGASDGFDTGGGSGAEITVFCDPGTAQEIVRAAGTGTITLVVRSGSDLAPASPSVSPSPSI